MTAILNRKNLEKLADYLESLPRRYKHFDMQAFFDRYGHTTPEQQVAYAKKNGGVDQFDCGTVACAIGHGPSAGVLFKPTEFRFRYTTGEKIPHWDLYAERFVKGDSNTFWWLFGSDWEGVDNHHYGAAARIRFILAGRAIPDDFEGDARPKYKALYKEFRK